jgi:hypothetical protein
MLGRGFDFDTEFWSRGLEERGLDAWIAGDLVQARDIRNEPTLVDALCLLNLLKDAR